MPLETIQLGRPNTNSNSKSNNDDSEGKSGFNATPEEMRAIAEKMKDPTFVKLMHEYMQSLEDPETLREEEAYLRQVEQEAKEGGDYSVEFIFPRAAFVVELMQPGTRRLSERELRDKGIANANEIKEHRSRDVSTFINFCSSDKVDEFREETTENRMGSSWHVPVSVSRKRVEYYEPHYTTTTTNNKDCSNKDEKTPLCFVYDAVYHPKTLALAERSARFLCFLVEIAVEQINAGYAESYGFEFHRLSSAIQAIGRPQNQTIRRKQDGKGGLRSPFAIQPNAPVLTRPTKHLPNITAEEEAKMKEKDAKKKDSITKKEGNAVITSQQQENSMKQLPPHTIVHRGRIDLSEAWNWRVREQRVGIPEELVVTLDFALCTNLKTATAIDIELSEDGHALVLHKTSTQNEYEGMLVLPFSVEDPPVKAQFDRSKRKLTLVLRVRPPPPLAGQRSAEEVRVELGLQPDPNEKKREDVSTEANEEEEVKEEEAVKDTAPILQTDDKALPVITQAETNAPEEPKEDANEEDKESTSSTSSSDSAPPPKLRPMLEYMQDSDRVRMMLEKVAEARRAREAAEAENSKDTTKDTNETTETPSAEVHEEEDTKQTNVEVTTQESKDDKVTSAEEEDKATQPVELIDLTSEAATKKNTVSNTQDEAEIARELAELRAQQDAWVAKMREEMAHAQAEQNVNKDSNDKSEQETIPTVVEPGADSDKDAAAQRAKAAEIRAQQRKLQAMREAERLEAEAQAKMNALPLSNKYIFEID